MSRDRLGDNPIAGVRNYWRVLCAHSARLKQADDATLLPMQSRSAGLMQRVPEWRQCGSDTRAELASSDCRLVGLLCVCDLDGTLLRSDGTLSGFARDALNRLVGAGVHVTIASGRSLQAVRALLVGVDLRLPVIGLNGALISELATGEHLLIRALAAPSARASISILAAHDASPVITSWDGSADRVHHTATMNAASEWWVAEKREYGDPRLRLSEDLCAVAGQEEIVLITGFVPDHAAERLLGRLQARLGEAAIIHTGQHIYCTGWTEFQI